MKQHEERINQIPGKTIKNESDDAQSNDSSPAFRQDDKELVDKQDGTDGLWSRLMRKWT
jgi:hypothetical protein